MNYKKTKKRKKSYIILPIIAILIVVLSVAYITLVTVPNLRRLEISQKLNYCHNKGFVQITVNEKTLGGQSITAERTTPDKNKEEQELDEIGGFTFLKGYKGVDTFKFVFDNKYSGLDKNIELILLKENEFNWNVNDFDIKLEFLKINGTLKMTGIIDINGKKQAVDETVFELEKVYKAKLEFSKELDYKFSDEFEKQAIHNKGTVEIIVQNNKTESKNITLERITPNGNKEKQTLDKDGKFSFLKGYKGKDTYKFYIDKASSGREKDIEIVLIKENEFDWNVNDFDIKISLLKKDGILKATGTVIINGEKVKIDDVINENTDIYSLEINL